MSKATIVGTDFVNLDLLHGAFTGAEYTVNGLIGDASGSVLGSFGSFDQKNSYSWQIGAMDTISHALEISDENLSLMLTSPFTGDREYAESILKLKRQIKKLFKEEV